MLFVTLGRSILLCRSWIFRSVAWFRSRALGSVLLSVGSGVREGEREREREREG